MLVNRMQQLARYPLLISADLEAGAGMRFDDTVNFLEYGGCCTGNPDYARRQEQLLHVKRGHSVSNKYLLRGGREQQRCQPRD